MFNDLENSNSQTPQAPTTPPENTPPTPATPPENIPQPPTTPPESTPQTPANSSIDDIFAETDKVPENHIGQPTKSDGEEIETKKVGLISEHDKLNLGEKKHNRNWFKILVTIIIIAIVILGGYLVYVKFFSSSPVIEQNLNVNTPTTPAPATPTEPDVATPTTPTEPDITTPVIPTEPDVVTPTEPITPVFVPIVDSDDDGLTDDEEIVAGTNINIIDTDNDGLSDYEEVKIYKSNPLNADSDGDGYQDGQEIRGGYNPNGPGMLPGNVE